MSRFCWRNLRVIGSYINSIGAYIIGVGDQNNDGFNDFMLFHRVLDDQENDKFALYYGGAQLDTIPDFTFPLVNNQTSYQIYGIGDANNDGFDDLMFTQTERNVRYALMLGAEEFEDTSFVWSVSFDDSLRRWEDELGYINLFQKRPNCGDYFGDGNKCLIINCYNTWEINEGTEYEESRFSNLILFFRNIDQGEVQICENLGENYSNRTWVHEVDGAGDFNGDGYPDVAVLYEVFGGDYRRYADIYYGGPDHDYDNADLTIPLPLHNVCDI